MEEAAADAFGRRHHIGNDVVLLIGIERTGPRHTALDFVKQEQRVMLIRQFAQPLQELALRRTHAAFALHGFNQERRRAGIHRRFRRRQIAERHIFETRQQGQEIMVHLFLIARRNRCHRAPVKGVVEGDNLKPARMARRLVIGARGFHRAFHRLRAAVGKEYGVGEGRVDNPLRKGLPLRATVKVGHMHQSRGLIGNRLGQMRVAVAKQIDGNAAGEIEIFLAIFTIKIAPLTAHRTHAAPGVNGHKRGNRHMGLLWRAAKVSGG